MNIVHCLGHEVKEIQWQETNFILGSSVVVLCAMIFGKQHLHKRTMFNVCSSQCEIEDIEVVKSGVPFCGRPTHQCRR